MGEVSTVRSRNSLENICSSSCVSPNNYMGQVWVDVWGGHFSVALKFICFLFLKLLFKYTCFHFPAITFPTPIFPPSILPRFGFVHGSFVHVPSTTLPLPSQLSPPHAPLVTVSLLFISMSLVIFCLLVCFVDYIPLKDETIWYLSLTVWLISLSIMLSSSIHAVLKGRSSFFHSAA